MKRSAYPPCRAHVFVCVHERTDDSGMPCCAAAAGEETFLALKGEIERAGLAGSVWVTATRCLGFCNAEGCTIALYPGGEFLVGVRPRDARAIVERAAAAAARQSS